MNVFNKGITGKQVLSLAIQHHGAVIPYADGDGTAAGEVPGQQFNQAEFTELFQTGLPGLPAARPAEALQ